MHNVLEIGLLSAGGSIIGVAITTAIVVYVFMPYWAKQDGLIGPDDERPDEEEEAID